MIFEEHGVFTVKVENSTLIVDATGPFNEQLMARFQTSIELATLSFHGQNWRQIIVLHQMSLFTPDAERILRETLAKRKQHGLTASGVVIKKVEGRSMMIEQLSRCYKSLDIRHAFFETIDDASAWLNSPECPAG